MALLGMRDGAMTGADAVGDALERYRCDRAIRAEAERLARIEQANRAMPDREIRLRERIDSLLDERERLTERITRLDTDLYNCKKREKGLRLAAATAKAEKTTLRQLRAELGRERGRREMAEARCTAAEIRAGLSAQRAAAWRRKAKEGDDG